MIHPHYVTIGTLKELCASCTTGDKLTGEDKLTQAIQAFAGAGRPAALAAEELRDAINARYWRFFHAPTDGREAEELRQGIEKLIEDIDDSDIAAQLQGLLDEVDARDSLAYLEAGQRSLRLLSSAPPGYELRCRRLGGDEVATWWNNGRQVASGAGRDRAAAIEAACRRLEPALPRPT